MLHCQESEHNSPKKTSLQLKSTQTACISRKEQAIFLNMLQSVKKNQPVTDNQIVIRTAIELHQILKPPQRNCKEGIDISQGVHVFILCDTIAVFHIISILLMLPNQGKPCGKETPLKIL